jgi:hypothetical protein
MIGGPKLGWWLSRIVGRKAGAAPSTPSINVRKSAPSSSIPGPVVDETDLPAATYDVNEYNWNGFSCPYCHAASFISCSGGHLVCDGSTENKEWSTVFTDAFAAVPVLLGTL